MSEAKRIGELLPGILARTERLMGLQDILNTMDERAKRKFTILYLRNVGRLSDDETELLISANMLEDA